MKNEDFFALILIMAVLFTLGTLVGAAIYKGERAENADVSLTNEYYYALTTVVTEVNRKADTVTCEDFNGNLWVFDGAEDWEVGDCASLLMNSNGTAKIRDDVVEGAKYSAWALGK